MEALEAETAGALGGISGESTYLPVAAVGLGTYRSRYLPTTHSTATGASQYQIISIPQVYFTLLLYPHQQQHHPASLSTYLPNYLNFQYPFFTPFFLFFRVSIQL